MDLNILPEVIVGEIFAFLPSSTLYTLNKTLFDLHYPKIIANFNDKSSRFQGYMRNIIRHNCDLQLQYLIDVKFTKWNKPLIWKYKQNTFPSYIVFLKFLAIQYDSQHCRTLIEQRLKTSLSTKNRHKKIRHKNNRWSN
jgi:hypothetical protein